MVYGQILDEIYWDDNNEHEVGNCDMFYLAKMVELGAYMHRVYFRGIDFCPVCITESSHPDIASQTTWYYWDTNMVGIVGRFVSGEEKIQHCHGFNKIIFRRKDKSYDT